MKQRLCLVLVWVAVGVFLGGCSFVRQEQQPQRRYFPAATLPTQMIFVMDEQADPIFLEGARLLSDKVLHLSQGQLEMQIQLRPDYRQQLERGDAQLALLDSVADAQYSALFPLLSRPFRYRDYKSFTLAANSQQLLEGLAEDFSTIHTTVPLAGYYQGSSHLLSTFSLNGNELLSYLQVQRENSVVVRERSDVMWAFQGLGAEVQVQSNPNLRLDMLTDGSAQVGEFTMDELTRLTFGDAGLVLTLSYHTINPMWLVADAQVYNQLNQRNYQALQEGIAFFSGYVDNQFLLRERQIIDQLAEKNIAVETDFVTTQDAINRLFAKEEELGRVGRAVVDKISSVS